MLFKRYLKTKILHFKSLKKYLKVLNDISAHLFKCYQMDELSRLDISAIGCIGSIGSIDFKIE